MSDGHRYGKGHGQYGGKSNRGGRDNGMNSSYGYNYDNTNRAGFPEPASMTACGRVRQRGDVARACVKRCVEVENRDTYEGYGCIHSRQQRKNVHQPWPLAT